MARSVGGSKMRHRSPRCSRGRLIDKKLFVFNSDKYRAATRRWITTVAGPVSLDRPLTSAVLIDQLIMWHFELVCVAWATIG
jgi:hypothetical protein